MKKRTIEVSHEVPKALFTASREFNNYDYMLDFCWDDKSYVDYYAKSLEEGRRVIFDNSLFEFYPEVPPMDRFYSHIKELNKNKYDENNTANDRVIAAYEFTEFGYNLTGITGGKDKLC